MTSSLIRQTTFDGPVGKACLKGRSRPPSVAFVSHPVAPFPHRWQLAQRERLTPRRGLGAEE